MKKLTLKDLSLDESNVLSIDEKRMLTGGESLPCQSRYFCKGTHIACDECAMELPSAECDCTLGGM